MEVQVQLPPPVNAITAETKETPPPVSAPIMAPTPSVASGTRPAVNPRLSRPSNDYYPSQSKTNKEEGSVVIKCTVGLDGKCSSPSVENSSGFPLLDEAAIKYANQGIRFVPGTEGGKPVVMSHMFKVTFNLKVTR